ncbi:hypothetical protein AAFF_G00194170 [Aldrovandia affinis]|uniref:coagulation factor Xa n=1 Tax=Aldrovandia affinis TaxID=143900 RepID=A0AAD7SXJ2_9TELE|nr:hypothetical protein AAFF_G00194170 [Aldrovandia affinis]
MSRLTHSCLLLLLLHQVSAKVFLQSQEASQVLTRKRRANSPFEEFRKGDMERECVEERCNYEEAREIFENDEKTKEFWNVYFDGDSCEARPCVNNGVCKDGIGGYTCYCLSGFQGVNCEIVIPQLCMNKNGECQHFCHVREDRVHCSCADNYFLGEDGKSCLSHEPFKCGVRKSSQTRSIYIYERQDNSTQLGNVTMEMSMNNVTDSVNSLNRTVMAMVEDLVDEDYIMPEFSALTRIVNGEECPPGDCPWQALLVNEEDIGFCGGTVINEYFILSAAHCMNQSRSFYIIVGEFDREVTDGNEAIHKVEQVLTHRRYVPDTFHNDIALIKLQKPIRFTPFILPACLPDSEFAEEVLMRQDQGMVSGFGRLREGGRQATLLQRLSVPFVDRAICIESSQFKITQRMFCAGYDMETKDACQGDSGGPHVTQFGETWFVTGVVSWGGGCAREGKYGVYTQVSKYISWIRHSQLEANTVIQRSRRANVFLFEEILQGSLERECFEELCDFEEAREYFEDIPKTNDFWAKYYDGDQCSPNPCLNGGSCTDTIGGYSCECKELYKGQNCERDVSQCHSDGPLSCDHFCRPSFSSYQCSCADGYRIHTDGRTCLPEVQYPCGRAPVPKPSEQNQTDPTDPAPSCESQICLNGRCPWQVRLLDAKRREFCSGVILSEHTILTTAACASRSKSILAVLGEHTSDAGEQSQVWPGEQPRGFGNARKASPVSRVVVHKRHKAGQPNDDLAFLHLQKNIGFSTSVFQTCIPEKDFSENVLMQPGREGLLAGREPGGTAGSPLLLSYLPLERCQTGLNLSLPLTNKMFCMTVQGSSDGGKGPGGSCGLLPGTPMVTVEKNSVFLTGLLISPQTHNCSQGHIFTKLSRYLPWIHQQLDLSEK